MTVHSNRTDIFRERSREIRRQPNDAESMVWNALRGRRLKGFKFRRQYPMGNYIADFYCAEARLIVELDGKTHEETADYDATRDSWMAQQDLQVMRFTNQEVNESFDELVEAVYRTCVERSGKSARGPGPSP